ncbi:hypothetical protein PQQ59_06110 [Paraburkholderia aspalathi]|uniref:hypothetical protein n=1 Tax=Paraburkholderia aspalathi TaxID=1324617 RepID=UPI0038BD9BC2
MAAIENVNDWDSAHAGILQMDGPTLIAQHLVQRGAINAIEQALELGPTEAVLRAMLARLQTFKEFVEQTAAAKGVDLISEEGPESGTHSVISARPSSHAVPSPGHSRLSLAASITPSTQTNTCPPPRTMTGLFRRRGRGAPSALEAP